MSESNEQMTVVVLGGYGAVGSAVCEALVRTFSGRVVVAGRNFQRAELLAKHLGERAEPMWLDASEPETYKDFLDHVSMVVNCVEGNNLVVARQCLAKSVHYVDVTATANVIDQLQTLDADARRAGAAVVYSVGVAPGLTNLLAHHAKSRCGPLKRLNIFVLLGLGEQHGGAAIEWTLKQAGKTFSIREDGRVRQVSAFSEGLSTEFPEPFGRRTAYRFDFSDQHTLPSTLELENVSTWLCFDSRAATMILGCLSRLRFFSILPLWRWSGAVSNLSRWVAMGGTEFAVQVDAVGRDGGERRFALVGDGEARITGVVAAHVAESLLRASTPSGALHIEQLLSLETILDAMDEKFTLTEK